MTLLTSALRRVFTATGILGLVTLLVGFGFVGAGSVLYNQGTAAYAQVQRELVAQHIVVSKDAPDVASRNLPVRDARTAEAEAGAIALHIATMTKGKTYAEMGKTDPTRATVFQGEALRTSLYESVLAFNLATLVTALGLAFAALGGLLLLAGYRWLRTPLPAPAR